MDSFRVLPPPGKVLKFYFLFKKPEKVLGRLFIFNKVLEKSWKIIPVWSLFSQILVLIFCIPIICISLTS
jgi:hypothetical protein